MGTDRYRRQRGDNGTATYFSYDDRGRAVWTQQDIPGLGSKVITYKYATNGQLKEVAYQPDNTNEAFYHYYQYDTDTRLTGVWVGRQMPLYSADDLNALSNATSLKQVAGYSYYLHGPLKTTQLGPEQLNYLYTVQGWIKGINADRLTAANAQGFAMELDYFSGDYTNVTGTLAGNSGGTAATVKYNGLVRSQTWRTEKPSGAAISDVTYAYRYTYDNRNQLSNAEFGTVTSGNFQSQGNVFREGQLSYDVNGNILTLARYNSTGGLLHDFTGSSQFQYDDTRTEYPLGLSNQLVQVPGYASYAYNSIGQMTSQTLQGSPAVSRTYAYTASGLLNTVSSGGQPLVSYTYDASDAQYLRLHYDNSTGQLARSTYYVRDVLGNVLAIYEQQSTDPAPVLNEYQLYGSGRIGQYRREGNVFAYVYELKDHVGSVRALLWQNDNAATASVYSFSDYYPFGLRMQNFNDLTYRYGYQGEYSEYDQDTKLNHFQLRDYDPVVGRWFGPDPYRVGSSPYIGMDNNPISKSDPDGGDTNDDIYKNSNSSVVQVIDTDAPDRYFLDGVLQEGFPGGADGSWRNYIGPNEKVSFTRQYFDVLKEDYNKLASGDILGFLFPDDDRMSFGFGGSSKVAGVAIKGAGKLSSYYAAAKGVSVIGPRATYREFAQKIGANFLNVTDEAWTMRKNVEFLQGVVKRGDDVIFSGKYNPLKLDPNSVLGQEIRYLQRHGYSWTDDFSRMIKK